MSAENVFLRRKAASLFGRVGKKNCEALKTLSVQILECFEPKTDVLIWLIGRTNQMMEVWLFSCTFDHNSQIVLVTRIPIQKLTKMMVEGENKEVLKYLRSLPKAECAEVKEQLIKNLEGQHSSLFSFSLSLKRKFINFFPLALQQQQQKPRSSVALTTEHAVRDKKPHGTTGRSSGRRDKESSAISKSSPTEKPSVDWAQAQKVVTDAKKGESKSVRIKGETNKR